MIPNDADYVQAVSTNMNLELSMRFFALCNAIDYRETSLCIGVGDDYAMYRGTTDPRFTFLPHDFDTIMGQGDTSGSTSRSIWTMVDSPSTTDPSQRANFLARFMRHPKFAPIYFRELKRLCDTVLLPEEFNPLLDETLGGWVPENTRTSMKNFMAQRRASILSQLPLTYTVNVPLSQSSGYYRSTSATATLNGTANALDTATILVNGVNANYTVWQGTWTSSVALQPGVNRVVVQCLDTNGVPTYAQSVEIWYDTGLGTPVSGSIAASTGWSAASGPYHLTGNLTINSGATLTIQPGTTLYLDSGVNLTVANGGRLVAEGTELAPIHFMRPPGTSGSWGGMTINGGASSPETRIAYAHFQGNGSTAIHSSGGTVFLDHLTFGSTGHQYVSLDGSSFVVSNCEFPTPTGSFEPVHGTGGIKSGGRGIFLRNFFGAANGYNDVVDFTGGNRPSPIVQFINNVFIGSGDDHLDLDSTDAWIEGNIFMHAHKNGSPDTASAVSGGNDDGQASEITIIGNIIYDCDQAAMAKQGDFYTLINNTIVHQTHQGGLDTEGAVVCVADDGTAQAAGMYLEGNILYDVEQLVRNQTTAVVTFTNNLMPLPWAGPGGDNSSADPRLQYIPQVAETTFTNWASAQVLWDWFRLRPGSPAAGTGPNGQDKGVPLHLTSNSILQPLLGVSIAGAPVGSTPQTSATLTIGVNRIGSGLSATGWPDGSGYTHYRWRLDGAVWSAETPLATPISLTGLPNGPHYVEVIGMNDADSYQNDEVLGPDAGITRTPTWIVSPAASDVRLNEILARNDSAVPVEGRFPDLIELYNAGSAPVDLTGMGLTDQRGTPDKFLFPAGTILAAHEYLVLYADNETTPAGLHLGFALNADGDDVSLFGTNGVLLDSVAFGAQLADRSIGRLADGQWALGQPTFGSVNVPVEVGDEHALQINEWLASSPLFGYDFIELYNPGALPVSLGGLFLTDNPIDWPDRHAIADLTFIPAYGYRVFIADGQPGSGPDHLNFALSADLGTIALFDTSLGLIDCVYYPPQQADISQGRSPNGGMNIVTFSQPTPGSANPGPTFELGFGLALNELMANNSSYTDADGTITDWVELYNGTNVTTSLAGMSLSDNLADPRRWEFPAGVSIPPFSYLKIRCEGSLPASTNNEALLNTGFGLKASGGGLYLFDTLANGVGLLSGITYGLQAVDFTIGRVPDGSTNWTLTLPTPTTANIAASLGSPALVQINEWMAEPTSGADWFELYNPSGQPVALGGMYLTDNLTQPTKSRIPAFSYLGAGTNGWQKFVADSDPAAGADHVDFKMNGDEGEELGLITAAGVWIDAVQYLPQLPGVSEGSFPDGSDTIVRFPGTDSPGESNYRWLTDVVINEVMTHTPIGSPFEDAIELHNVTDASVDISSWWLSDSRNFLQKFRIPDGTILPAQGYQVFYENQFNFDPINDPERSFALSGAHGDDVILSSADATGELDGYRTRQKFGAASAGVSLGRYVDSLGQPQFVALNARTFGADDPATVEEFRMGTGESNAYPLVGPIVISEIMFNPPRLGTNDNVRDEYIELYNSSMVPVPLYDSIYPTNTWSFRDGVDFTFPTNMSIASGDFVLVVSFDPVTDPDSLAAFRATYQLNASATIVGPYSGKLNNDGEKLGLYKPDVPVNETNQDDSVTVFVPSVLVEQVDYLPGLPWPIGASGTSNSLQRVSAAEFGNDPANWIVGAPNPGPQAVVLDSDGDGMPDAWEDANGLKANDPTDASEDPDGDGLTNLEEYRAGTNPHDGTSSLAVTITTSGGMELSFVAVADHSYTVEYRDSLSEGTWLPLELVPALSTPATRVVNVSDPEFSATRFYRIRTP